MRDKILIGQISDSHIKGYGTMYQDVDVCANFEKVIAEMKARKVDLVVLSGDLAAENGEIEAYQWIFDVLAKSGLKYEVMMGNHDKLDNLCSIFPKISKDIKDDLLYFRRNLKGYKLFFLDSGNFKVEAAQWKWLKNQIKELAVDEEVYLFVHHPLKKVGHKFMDSKYALKNIDESWGYLKDIQNIKHIFCGHYHFDKRYNFKEKTIYLAPSSYMQINSESEEFKRDSTYPSCSYITISEKNIDVEVAHYTE